MSETIHETPGQAAEASKPLAEILAQDVFSDADIARILSATSPEDCRAIQQRAYDVTTREVGPNVYLRGLIEASNVCTANCRYCGIRKANHALERYTLSEDTILGCALYAAREGYGSIAIQAGERRDPKWIEWIAKLLRRIHAATVSEALPNGLGVTLSLGEQTPETYRLWAEASGNLQGLRYLLRIESSNPALFRALHCTPGRNEKVLEHRYRALADLRDAGYQVGTGVMIGLPGQTIEDLVADIRTFERINADMIGMGPYITSDGADMVSDGMMARGPLMQLSLNMIAAVRLVMKNVNIAAATALESLEPNGRIRGILYGCNVVMPNITPQATRASYQLYANKAGCETGAESNILVERNIVEIAHRMLGLNRLGSSRRWSARTGEAPN